MSKVEWEGIYCTKVREHFRTLPSLTYLLIENAENILEEIIAKLKESTRFIDDLKDGIKWSAWFKEKDRLDMFPEGDIVHIDTDIKMFLSKEGDINLKVFDKQIDEFICWIQLFYDNRYSIKEELSKLRDIMKMLQMCEQMALLNNRLYLGTFDKQLEIKINTYKQQIRQVEKVRNVERRAQILLQIIKELELQRNILIYDADVQLQKLRICTRNSGTDSIECQSKRDNWREKNINEYIKHIKENIYWINKFSFYEMLAYYYIEEIDAAKESFKYYVEYLSKVLYDEFYKKEQESLLKDRMKDIYDIADNIDGIRHIYHINQRSTL